MSDESVPKPPAGTQDPVLARVPRREALKGLGVLAVSTTAFAAVGCSSEDMTGSTDVGAEPSGASGAATTTSSSTATGTSATAGASSAKPPSSTTTAPGASGSAGGGAKAAGMSTNTASAAGSSSPASSGSAGSATASAAGSPAVGGTSPGASAAGAAANGGAGTGAAAMTPAMTGGAVDISSLACIATPAQDEGPFFIEEKLNRSDLLMGETSETIVKALPLALTIGVYKVNGTMCEPMPGLQVDIWHADANGIYSDVSPGFVQSTDTKGKQFLRGYQITGESGLVNFSTIYPGWYPSRTIHIHFKIRMPMGSAMYDFTSQMYFDENITKEVLTMGPYAKTPGTRMVFNDDDHIFNGTQMNGQKPASGKKPPGEDTMVTLAKAGNGYTGMLKIGLKI